MDTNPNKKTTLQQCCTCGRTMNLHYCFKCHDYYCIRCSKHGGLGSTSHEQYLCNADDVTPLPCFPTERCFLHKTKILDIYCRNHDEVLCGTCVDLYHRTCLHIYTIPYEIDTLLSCKDTQKKMAKYTPSKEEELNRVKEHILSELKKNKKEAIDSIKQFRHEMDAVLEELENETINRLEHECKSIEVDLHEKIKEAEKYLEDMEQFYTKHQMYTNTAQKFVVAKLSKKINLAATALQHRLYQETNTISFTVDSRIEKLFKKLDAFGQVTKTKPTDELKASVYTVKRKNQIDIPQRTVRGACSFHGACVAADGFLLLADNFNKKLSRVDMTSMAESDHLDLDFGPIAICQINRDKAATSLNSNAIQFVTLGKKMKTTKRLQFDHDCYGLAYKDKNLFISDACVSVYIHDLTGTMLRKITTDVSGNPIFSSNRHLCLSSDGNKLYVADKNKGLIILDILGNYESTFSHPLLVDPWGVCTDGKGKTFACGYGSSCIVQIQEKGNKLCGKHMSELSVLDNVKDGISACFDPQRKLLFVTVLNSDTLTVYKLE